MVVNKALHRIVMSVFFWRAMISVTFSGLIYVFVCFASTYEHKPLMVCLKR